MSKKKLKKLFAEPSVFEHPAFKVPVERLLEAAQARKDPSLHVPTAPEGYHLRGVSTLVDGTGQPMMTWVKTTKDALQAEELVRIFKLSTAAEPISKVRSTVPPKNANNDLLTVIPVGDPHYGMLSWHAETGENFDLKIASANMRAAFSKLLEIAPASDTCLIMNMGDAIHSDGYGAATTKGTKVDVDGRWPKMVQVFIESMIECIILACKKHKKVKFFSLAGNHDTHFGFMLALCLNAHFKDQTNVEVLVDPGKLQYFEHGKCLIGATHGDTIKFEKLPGVMSTDRQEAWGTTRYRRFYVGHWHNNSVKEFPGCIVESVRTLAPKDAWAHNSGYRSGRSIFCDVWHKERGKILRHEVEVDSL